MLEEFQLQDYGMTQPEGRSRSLDDGRAPDMGGDAAMGGPDVIWRDHRGTLRQPPGTRNCQSVAMNRSTSAGRVRW